MASLRRRANDTRARVAWRRGRAGCCHDGGPTAQGGQGACSLALSVSRGHHGDATPTPHARGARTLATWKSGLYASLVSEHSLSSSTSFSSRKTICLNWLMLTCVRECGRPHYGIAVRADEFVRTYRTIGSIWVMLTGVRECGWRHDDMFMFDCRRQRPPPSRWPHDMADE